MTLLSNPEQFSRYTYSWVWWDNVFSDEELAQLVKYCGDVGATERAQVIDNDAENTNDKIRRTNIKFHYPNEENSWIFQKLYQATEMINDRFYKFDLLGWEMFQYGEYHSKEGGKYDWHTDLIYGDQHNMTLTRKMSLVLFLNDDYEGGEFEVTTSNEQDPQQPEAKPGRIIAFPSWIHHRVKPVTSGIRKSIVIWAMGPKFK